MAKRLGNRRAALGAAFFLTALAGVDTSYAQTIPDEQVIALPDSQNVAAQELTTGADTTFTLPTTEAATLELSGISSVDAKSIALVSISVRQIELAKTADGARQVANALIKDSYSDWNNSQISCLNQLWTGESHWNFQAHNYRSGAQGIAQALPPTKMEIVSTDWRTNPVTQIKWGLSYIKARYETPCKALRHKHWRGYY